MAAKPPSCLRLPASDANLPRLMEFVNHEAQAAGLSPQDLYRVELAAEEVLTNIIKYAYPQGQTGSVEVACGLGEGRFWMEFRDQGTPFDPVNADKPTVEAALAERPVGGLGIHLVRQIMDQVTYQRQGGDNLLTLSKQSQPEEAEPS